MHKVVTYMCTDLNMVLNWYFIIKRFIVCAVIGYEAEGDVPRA